MSIGVFNIITNHKNEVLLVKRTDYPLWDLPGGTLKENESLEACAWREAYEETGYQIASTNKVGTFYRPRFNDTQHLFVAKIESSQPLISEPETKELCWFKLNRLPFGMIPNRRKQINYFKQGQLDCQVTLKDYHPLLHLERLLKPNKK